MKEERRADRVRVGKEGMSSMYGHRYGKSKSRLSPEAKKGPGWRSWGNPPSQGGLGRATGWGGGLLKQETGRLL